MQFSFMMQRVAYCGKSADTLMEILMQFLSIYQETVNNAGLAHDAKGCILLKICLYREINSVSMNITTNGN